MRKSALISVRNKFRVVEFAEALISLGFDLIASSGTYKVLTEAGLSVTDTAKLVGEAILDHKVVTLSRELHAGLLGDLVTELDELEQHNISPIHLVCVDTYPLTAAIADPNATPESVKESTDIGGPAMLRSGAKGDRIVICEFDDRQRVIDWFNDGSPNSEAFINELAAKAEGYVANYCLQSAQYRSGGKISGFIGTLKRVLKYGENAWQKVAGLFSFDTGDPLGISKFNQIAGVSVWLRERLRELGMQVLAPDSHASPAVLTIALPSEVPSKSIGWQLKKSGFLLSYNSEYLLKRNWIQICLMGEWSRDNLITLPDVLAALCSQRRRKMRDKPVLQPAAI